VSANKTLQGADPVFGYATPDQLVAMLDTVEASAKLARDELLDATDYVQDDGATNVLYALGEIRRIAQSAREFRSSFECTAAKAVAEAQAQYEQEMADADNPNGSAAAHDARGEEARKTDAVGCDDLEPSVGDVVEAEDPVALAKAMQVAAKEPIPTSARGAEDPVALARAMQGRRHGGAT
jgi:hypothetical protein